MPNRFLLLPDFLSILLKACTSESPGGPAQCDKVRRNFFQIRFYDAHFTDAKPLWFKNNDKTSNLGTAVLCCFHPGLIITVPVSPFWFLCCTESSVLVALAAIKRPVGIILLPQMHQSVLTWYNDATSRGINHRCKKCANQIQKKKRISSRKWCTTNAWQAHVWQISLEEFNTWKDVYLNEEKIV